jgi:rod shape-determining protein MreC
MENTHAVRFFNRGPSPIVRLVFFCLLSLLLLFIDARYQYLESVRGVLSFIIQPVQRLGTVPAVLWREAGDYFVTHNTLTQGNADLREQHARDAAQLQQLQGLQAENAQLRALLEVRQRLGFQMQLAEIIYVERDVFKHKLFIDKGSLANVQAGQVVMDESGIVGQVTRVYSRLAEVTQITDKDHEVPVQVLRNGLRTIMFGSGDRTEMALRYAPVAADIQANDILVTSGIDGTYPPGLPVAKVSHIERDPAYPFARVLCTPMGGVNSHRFLFVLSSQNNLPPRPADATDATANEKAKKGRRRAP